jgi:hypothetical protein
MGTIPPSIRRINDTQIEYAIQQCYLSLISAPDAATKHERWRQLVHLVNRRSPEAVARLEQERGLVVRK